MRIDFGRTQPDYAAYRPAFAPELFERLRAWGIGLPPQRVLDVGGGTGLFARPLAQRGCDVVIADVSPKLLSSSGVNQRVAAAVEWLPFADEAFDVVTAAQCWHWFDRRTAPRQIMRILRAGGAVVAVYQTYVPLADSVAEATEKLILAHHPGWRHANSTGINGQVLRDVQIAGFERIESFSFDVMVDFTRDAWRGCIRATSPIGASMPPERIARFDREHAALLNDWPAMLSIPHRIFAAVAHKPAAGV